MRFFSYFIIVIVAVMVGFSSQNSINLINQKDFVALKQTLPNFQEQGLLEPLVNLIIADLES